MLPPIDSTVVPADVRQAGKQAEELYASALGFEQLLVRQLATQLAATAEGDEEGSAAAGAYRQLLPDALAEGVSASGGIGLARELYRALATEELR